MSLLKEVIQGQTQFKKHHTELSKELSKELQVSLCD